MRSRCSGFVLICAIAWGGAVRAQESVAPKLQALIDHEKSMYAVVEKMLLRSAELMPEERYDFRPAPSVRTFGEILDHVARAQLATCAQAIGTTAEPPAAATSREDHIANLASAFAYCSDVYGSLTEANATEPARFHGTEMPRFTVMTTNLVHTIEHYGNLVTYLRMNDLVPPTSDPKFMTEATKRR